MKEYKKPMVASVLTLLLVISVLAAAFGLLLLVAGGRDAAKFEASIALVAGLSSSIMLAWMVSVVEYLAKIHHRLTRDDA